MRLKELAAVRVRYGYRRLTILLRREGWEVGPRRIYRLYRQERNRETNPFREKIEARAHEIYLARGAEPGHELEDWLQAENELMGRGWV
jgi:hypothetical protein